MRHRAATLVAALGIAAVVGGCSGDRVPTVPTDTSATAGPTGAMPPASDSWVEDTLGSMTVEEKVGQLFVPRVYGTRADTTEPDDVARNRADFGVDNALGIVQRFHIGGLVYFGENVTTPEALAEFGNAVQAASGEQRVPVPVLTAIDQEQGNVVRIGSPATVFAGSMALGAGRSVEDASSAARITGEELRAMGVFQDYAPVADVNVNPRNPVIGVRSYSSRPALVSAMTAAQVTGYQESGVVATAKHFPGHGDTDVDSHTGLPVIGHDRATMRAVDLRPFRAAISAGVGAVMTAHIVVPSMDPSGDPATLSRRIVTGLLRERLGFTGVVVTDSLRMEGVRTKYGDARVPVLAILAGADQLLDPPNLRVAFDSILGAVASGEISTARLDESVRRILSLKASIGLTSAESATVDVAAIPEVVGTPEHLTAASTYAERSTTVVRDAGDLIPLDGLQGAAVLATGRGAGTTGSIADLLSDAGASVTLVETGSDPEAADITHATDAARGQDVVVVATFDVSLHPRQVRLVEALMATGTPVIAVAVGTPYDVAWFPAVPAFIATYSYQAVALASLVDVIAGQVVPTGRLPVAIPSARDPDVVLYPFGWPGAASVAGE